MTTVFEYTQKHILVVPQSLFSMKDVKVHSQHQGSLIFYKSLERDLVDIEFYINRPCLVYIKSGQEVISSEHHDTLELRAGSAVFFSQGLTLHSDFVKRTQALQAYLVFFDTTIISQYLATFKDSAAKVDVNKASSAGAHTEPSFSDGLFFLPDAKLFDSFFNSIEPAIDDSAYLSLKFQELLHLIAWQIDVQCDCTVTDFMRVLSSKGGASPKRNLSRLLESHDILRLNVNDLANLSGRSVSSFQRDFKQLYDMPPQKWLREKRLSHAKSLLEQRTLSVTEVAFEVGYESVSNFIKVFKGQYGLTPKQLQASL